jgi:hypothetical protein
MIGFIGTSLQLQLVILAHDPLYPHKLALTSPTSGGRSVGVVRLRARATEFYTSYDYLWCVT